MMAYAIIMFITSVIFGILAAQIYNGKTDLIHDYHQTKVSDKAAYGKDFGKAMAGITAALALSGVVALLGETYAWIAVAVLFVGLLAGIIAIVRVQKKHNGGMF